MIPRANINAWRKVTPWPDVGTFSVRHKAERMGRNPKTGEEVPIAARRVVVFKPSLNLKHVCNHPEDLRRKVPRRQIELF